MMVMVLMTDSKPGTLKPKPTSALVLMACTATTAHQHTVANLSS